MTKLNRDLLNMLDVRQTANATMTVIDSLQRFTPEMQITALTAAYKLMVERFDVSPHDILTVADNIMNHAEGRRSEFLAVADYMEGEL